LKILGIDPALNKLGYGILSAEGNRVSVGLHGTVCPKRTLSYNEKLIHLHRELETIVAANAPDVIAMEEIYLDKNVRVALKIGQVMGIVIGIGLCHNLPFALIPPREIKQAVTGTGAATKEQVRFMVEQLTGKQIKGTMDESDAIAAAFSYLSWKKEDDLLRYR